MARNDREDFHNPWKIDPDIQPLLKELRLRKQRGDLYHIIEYYLADVIDNAVHRKTGRAEIIDAVMAIASICAADAPAARDELITFGNWLRRDPLPPLEPDLVHGLVIRITEALNTRSNLETSTTANNINHSNNINREHANDTPHND